MLKERTLVHSLTAKYLSDLSICCVHEGTLTMSEREREPFLQHSGCLENRHIPILQTSVDTVSNNVLTTLISTLKT